MSHSNSLETSIHSQTDDIAARHEPNTALKKALAALELFAGEARPMSAAMVAIQLGMSRQAAGRVIRQMEELGLVLRLPDDHFILGPRAKKLSIDVIRSSHISASVHAILEGVVSRVGETSNVGMLDGYELVYIDRVECNWPLRAQLRPGSRVPSHCTAMGKLLLAHLPPRRRERLLSVMPLKRFTERTITEPSALSEHFRLIRKQGFSINDQEDSVGLVALAVPIRNSAGKVFAGLAIHGPEARMPIETAKEHLGLLDTAAAKLSEALEFSSSGE